MPLMPRPQTMRFVGATSVLMAAWLHLNASAAAPVAGAADGPRHLIYLHGRIVQEEQNARPKHPQYGYYELDAILDTFRKRGFVVHGGIRPKAATVSESADKVVAEVRRLIESGVPADRIVVVGASMGASIAFLASVRLQNPDLSFAVLGACLSANVRQLVADEGRGPGGRVLSIREASDGVEGSCPPWTADSGKEWSVRGQEIVLETGLAHGFLYRPLPEWVNPLVEWASLPNPGQK
jgi:pimeloyl-ACP methyl ester carboxylesterase